MATREKVLLSEGPQMEMQWHLPTKGLGQNNFGLKGHAHYDFEKLEKKQVLRPPVMCLAPFSDARHYKDWVL
ncbi:hypothetical protein JTE90_002577 [Oedothorax gibbosus]|uniref:Uncharacterized protein n=1 Tax=Oedothorax gibbosus TaxID=931172 RepID=A0AAV6TTB4_9ARAC|nr:hypothetical protein JTE90_002577 [Oedothorax gibbosus]